jgi:hypothetical protein
MEPMEAWRFRRRQAGRRDAACDCESGEFRTVLIGDDRGQGTRFCSNFVRTSKYTLLTFLPLFLRNAFDPRVHSANTFFLVICAMQCVPYITYTAIITIYGVDVGTPTTLMPLGFVVTVDAIFQALEDLTRHRTDAEANDAATRIVDPRTGAVVPAPWRDVRVGDVVVLRNREVSPADARARRMKTRGSPERRGGSRAGLRSSACAPLGVRFEASAAESPPDQP